MKFISSLLTLILVLGVFSCNTDEDPNAGLTGDTSAAVSDEINGDEYFNVVEELSVSAMESNESDARISIEEQTDLACANISFVGTLNHGDLTVDFGSEGCADSKGKLRKGKIIITLDGSWQQLGNSATITLVDFSYDGVEIEGSWTVTGKGSTEGSVMFETKLVNGKVTWPNGVYASREAIRTYTILYDLQNLTNISVSVEGSASGTTRTGLNYESVITDPLIFKPSCAASQSAHIPVQGIMELTSDKSGFAKVLVNFGAGECDQTFTVTVGAITKQMTPEDLD